MLKVVTDLKPKEGRARRQDYFKACKDCGVTPHSEFKVISAILSIPGSNTFAERAFSMTNVKWRADSWVNQP